MRAMKGVREAILNVIDDPQVRSDFLHATDPVLESLPYTAPEAMSYRWREFCSAMAWAFGDTFPSTPSGRKALAILRGEVDYRIYLPAAQPLPG